uniref:Putative secreted protein n=1 Tax=Anopheles darlingi TaxID=43151 RepID=A0A2M4DRM8_ANODA
MMLLLLLFPSVRVVPFLPFSCARFIHTNRRRRHRLPGLRGLETLDWRFDVFNRVLSVPVQEGSRFFFCCSSSSNTDLCAQAQQTTGQRNTRERPREDKSRSKRRRGR